MFRILLGKLQWASSPPNEADPVEKLIPAPTPVIFTTAPPPAPPPPYPQHTKAPIHQSPLDGPTGPVVTAFSSLQLPHPYANLRELEDGAEATMASAHSSTANGGSALMLSKELNPRRTAYRASLTSGDMPRTKHGVGGSVRGGTSTGTLDKKSPYI